MPLLRQLRVLVGDPIDLEGDVASTSPFTIPRERGQHRIVFANRGESGRRFILVSKSGDFPRLVEEDFHWVAVFPPCDPEAPTAVVAQIDNGLWTFASADACVCYGTLAVDDAEPRLPSWAPQWECVTFSLEVNPLAATEIEATSVNFLPEGEQLPTPKLRDAYRRFYAAYAKIDGHAISQRQFDKMTIPPVGLTYGECHFLPVYRLFQQIGVVPQDIVVDLGSGTGRIVLAVALAFPDVRACVGVELLPGLHDAAVEARQLLQQDDGNVLGEEEGDRASWPASASIAPVCFVQADILKEDWSNASIVIAMSLCFPADLTAALEAKALTLRQGAKLVTMHCFFAEGQSQLLVGCRGPRSAAIRPVMMRTDEPRHAVEMEMSFGSASVFVYERVDYDVLCLESMD